MSNPDPNDVPNETNSQMMGGRRKGHKTRKEPNVLKSWRKFVRKVQHEEHLTYPKAMKRASQRKSEWQRGGATTDTKMGPSMDTKMGPSMDTKMGPSMGPSMGGRRRRSRKQRGGDEGEEGDSMDPSNEERDYMDPSMGPSMGGRRRRSRKQRGGNAPAPAPASASVADFDSDWKQYGKVGGSRKRRHRR